ncbi:hypothetical protein NL676_004768 [Syzygium grande]|nr:hypothetical protein NL676_004768 [Syzygium grande]
MSESPSEHGNKSRETSEVFDSETMVPQPRRRATVDDDTTNRVPVDEEQSLKKEGDGNARQMSDKLPGTAKDGIGKFVANVLNMLKFPGRCFGLFAKDVSSQSQEAPVKAGYEMDRGMGNERFSVRHHPTIGKPPPPRSPPRHPRPNARR